MRVLAGGLRKVLDPVAVLTVTDPKRQNATLLWLVKRAQSDAATEPESGGYPAGASCQVCPNCIPFCILPERRNV
jgi:hypothetical protein